MVWNISTGQLGYLSGHAPSRLLHTCSSAEYEKLEEVLDFIATDENISVINKKQQLLRGKLTLSQPKTGQSHIFLSFSLCQISSEINDSGSVHLFELFCSH